MMSKIEDFENAPVGATASLNGSARVWKSRAGETPWATAFHYQWFSNEELAERGYTLEHPAPTSARGAIDLTWELAHEVEPGQVIPADTRFLEITGVGLGECIAHFDFEIDPAHVRVIRTLEPLPDLEPEWVDAPAVLARLDEWASDEREVFIPAHEMEGRWVAMFSALTYHWSDLRDVTPLYPKEEA